MAVPKGKPVPGSAKTDSNNDPYAAWAEYFKQYPEYYEAMMKAYSNPATMAAYYSQYYGSTYPGAAPGPASMPTSMEFPNNGPYDPTQYAGLMSAVSGAPNVSIDTPIDYRPPGTTVERFSGGDYYRSHGNRPERRHERSRRRSRSRSPTSSHSRSRSRSRGRNRSRSPSRDHHRDRRRDRTYQRPRRDVEQGHDNTSSLDQEQERQQYSPTDSMGRIDGLDQARPVDYSGGRDTSRHPRSYHPYSRSSEKQ